MISSSLKDLPVVRSTCFIPPSIFQFCFSFFCVLVSERLISVSTSRRNMSVRALGRREEKRLKEGASEERERKDERKKKKKKKEREMNREQVIQEQRESLAQCVGPTAALGRAR